MARGPAFGVHTFSKKRSAWLRHLSQTLSKTCEERNYFNTIHPYKTNFVYGYQAHWGKSKVEF